MPQTPPRQRGGQPNNTNALKHGIYATTLHLQTLRILEQQTPSDPQKEKQFLNAFLHRITTQLNLPGDSLPAQLIITLTLLRYLNANHQLPAGFNPQIEQAYAQILQEILPPKIQ